jgi:hypothetical protein
MDFVGSTVASSLQTRADRGPRIVTEAQAIVVLDV